jgi:hypothetical protein
MSLEHKGRLAIRVIAIDGSSIADPVIHVGPAGGVRRRWSAEDLLDFGRHEFSIHAKGFHEEKFFVDIDSPHQSLIVELQIGRIADSGPLRQRFIRKADEPCRTLVLTPVMVPRATRLFIPLDQEVTDVVGGLISSWYFAALVRNGTPCHAQLIQLGGPDAIRLGSIRE